MYCKGSAILWNTKATAKSDLVEQYGIEGKSPTPLQKNKSKRNQKQRESKWKRNVLKRKREAGEEYTYKTKSGETAVRSQRLVKDPCPANCKKKCTEKITEEERKRIHENFWKLSDPNLKNIYLSKLVKITPKLRERKRKKASKRRNRQSTRSYSFIKLNGERITECQKFFFSTLDISEKRVRTILKKTTESGTIEKDGRGKAGGKNKIDEETINRIKDHIMMFRTIDSHYVRKESKCEYLSEHLSVAEMHRLYIQWCEEHGHQPQQYLIYYEVFKSSFNLKFQQPKKDQCDTCIAYHNTLAQLRTSDIETAHQRHINEKDLARQYKQKMKEEAINNSTVLAAGFDFQKTLLSPHGRASSFYYSLRLKNYNFTVTELHSMKTTCFLWNECEGKKGSCEVATCLLQFLSRAHSNNVKKVQFFCDRCCGQNSNCMVYLMLAVALEM